MKIKPLYQVINQTQYWTGFSEGGATLEGEDVIEVDDEILSSIQYIDENGNPQWILNPPNSVTQKKLSASPLVKAKNDIEEYTKILNSLMIDMIDAFLNKKELTKAIKAKWDTAYQNLQAAYGSAPGIVKP